MTIIARRRDAPRSAQANGDPSNSRSVPERLDGLSTSLAAERDITYIARNCVSECPGASSAGQRCSSGSDQPVRRIGHIDRRQLRVVVRRRSWTNRRDLASRPFAGSKVDRCSCDIRSTTTRSWPSKPRFDYALATHEGVSLCAKCSCRRTVRPWSPPQTFTGCQALPIAISLTKPIAAPICGR